MNTPAWILKWCEDHNGGWAHPMALSPDHPIVVEGWLCLYCEQPLQAHHWVVMMPFSPQGYVTWSANHRECLLRDLGTVCPAAYIDPLPYLLSRND